MLYRLLLDDKSFIVVDENYSITLFHKLKKKKVTIKDYLSNDKLKDYYLLDLIDNNKIKRYFKIEELPNISELDLEFPIGSRIKLAKDIQLYDLVVAPDGSPRRIKELHTGQEEMFEICVGGNTYTVNSSHILALVDKDTGEHLEIQVGVYMHMDDEFRSHYVMEQVIDV